VKRIIGNNIVASGVLISVKKDIAVKGRVRTVYIQQVREKKKREKGETEKGGENEQLNSTSELDMRESA